MSSKRKILVGVFIIGGILLFAVGLFLIGSRNQLFSHQYEVYTDFNSIDTLTAGAKVRVSGMDAGSISDIAVPKTASGKFRLKLKVDEKFRPIIRQDSVASIETEGMVGNKYLDIAKGNPTSAECQPGCTLPSQAPVEISDLMRQASGIANTATSTINDIRMHTDTAIEHVTRLVGHVDSTVQASRGDVKAITSNGAHLTENANDLVGSIREGHGAAGKLLEDPTVANNISQTIANAKAASAGADQAVKKVDAMTAQLNQAVSSFLQTNNKNGSTADRLRDTVQSADRAATNVADDTAAIKHNFFLRGFFKRRGFFDMNNLTPKTYASTRFVKKPEVRVWVPSFGVFTSEPGGAQKLSNNGKMILDQDMSRLVPYLPNNPIMVEGYSSNGTADQQYMTSRQRAMDVRDYLESKFHIDAKYIGAIPLGDHPPRGAGRETWDGVCLVLVRSQ